MLNPKLYKRNANLTNFQFFQRSNFHGHVMIPGALTAYTSFADFTNQLKAPLIIPIVSLAKMVKVSVNMARDLLLFGLNVLTFTPKTFEYASKVFEGILNLLALTVKTLCDTLSSVIILATRTLATAGAGVNAAYRLVCGENSVATSYRDEDKSKAGSEDEEDTRFTKMSM